MVRLKFSLLRRLQFFFDDFDRPLGVAMSITVPILTSRVGLDHAQAVIRAAGDRASRFRANGRPRRHGPARPLDRDAAAGEEST